jgi:hypothetical protein
MNESLVTDLVRWAAESARQSQQAIATRIEDARNHLDVAYSTGDRQDILAADAILKVAKRVLGHPNAGLGEPAGAVRLQDQSSAPEWTCLICGKDALWCEHVAEGRPPQEKPE